jgi:replication-associated recombination protein RarA
MQMSGKTAYKTEDANLFAERLDMGAYGRFLIGIIDDADRLSETVQNKLLKTLEEPREGVLLFLGSSNPDHLLDTVRSRCSIIRTAGYLEDEEREGVQESFEKAAGMLSGGCMFYEFRDVLEKSVKTREDALALVGAAEDLIRERMLAGEDPAVMAMKLECCEKARADIERDMDKNKALKRLCLELSGR